MTTKATTPASTKIATCYDPKADPGSGRCIEIRKFAGPGDPYVVAEIHNGTAVHSRRVATQTRALEIAANLGYTDVLRADEVPHASGSLHVDGEMTDAADYET
jgi:hypothetical protein